MSQPRGVAPLEGGSAVVPSPKFTILTTSFNQGAFLEATIRSVADQRRADVEHLVLDGGSTDGSVEVLRAMDANLAYWSSAPDGGQPAALNAGLRRARGEVIAFLNSDDLYLPGALDHVAALADSNRAAGDRVPCTAGRRAPASRRRTESRSRVGGMRHGCQSTPRRPTSPAPW